jgi:hypothetical protein
VSSRGHADFFPNSGYKQNGCELELFTNDVCSHRRAWVYYQESVFPRKPFLAVKCDSYDDFKAGKCKNNTITTMGLSDSKEEGNFYLITHSNPLFASLGEDGIEYKDFSVITEDGTTNKPLVMSNSKPKWEKSIEFKTLLVITDYGEIEKESVELSSPLELMGDDFEYVSDSGDSIKINRAFLFLGSLTVIILMRILIAN